MNYKITNKWVVVFGAISMQIAIGAVYAWSLFNTPISEAHGWEFNGVVTTYAISLVAFSLATMLSGRIQLIKGPRFTALIGGVLYSSGIFLSGFATSTTMLYITYGVMGGAGVGFVYVCPLTTLVKWFPTKKGAATGVATAAFGIGAIAFKQVITRMLDISEASTYTIESIANTFFVLGIIYAVMTIGGALLIDTPEASTNDAQNSIERDEINYKTSELFSQVNFYKLLLSYLLALMPGLLILGLAKDIGSEYIGLKDSSLINAAALVSYLAIFNASGRLISGRLADKFGALSVYRVIFLITIFSLLGLRFIQLAPVAIILMMMIGFSFGSFLALVPTITAGLFGSKNFSANYGLVYQAYGIAAVLGIFIKNSVTFEQAFLISTFAAVGGLLIAIRDNNQGMSV